MNAQYITENDAANFAGVSTNTLNRFVETGYLRLEIGSDGGRLFSKDELNQLFSVTVAKPLTFSSPIAEEKVVKKEMTTPEEKIAEPVQRVDHQMAAPFIEPEKPQETIAPSIAPTVEQSEQIKSLEYELFKAKRVIELQENILNVKDQQIEELKTQRDWLKERIEKLEERSHREQMLLMAETETIRNLVHLQKKRNPIRVALEWFNILPPPPEERAPPRTVNIPGGRQ